MPINLPPEQIKLSMPDRYKRFIAGKWKSPHLLVFVGGALPFLTAVMDIVHRHTTIAWMHVILFGTTLILWPYLLWCPWHYVISKNGIAGLISYSASSWTWMPIYWKQAVILSIIDGQWEDLPALIIRVAPKRSRMERMEVLQFVYSADDENKVREKVIPAIEYYRAKYGHEAWIEERGWETYTQPSAF